MDFWVQVHTVLSHIQTLSICKSRMKHISIVSAFVGIDVLFGLHIFFY